MHSPDVPPGDKRHRLSSLCRDFFSGRRLIIASNRGPLEFQVSDDGRVDARRGSGGLVTALGGLGRLLEFTWVASPLSEGDRRLIRQRHTTRFPAPFADQAMQVRFVPVSGRTYHRYYNVICNPLLWFLQHYMWNSPYSPNIDAGVHEAWHQGYVLVNQAFAQAILEEAQGSPEPPVVMVQDYHLYLVPNYVRRGMPEAMVLHYTHIPWPSPRYWALLPMYMRRSIMAGLLGADVVGFQTINDVRNFLECCEVFVEEAEVDWRARTVMWQERLVRVKAYPISIDVAEVRRLARSRRAQEYVSRLAPLGAERTIVRVDRLEPSKNIVRGFKAFQLLLGRYPELRERVSFLAFLVPSRTHVRQYQRYQAEVEDIVDSVNTTFGTPTWRPITVFLENNYVQALAGMTLYDVLLVNPIVDGMNLVAKEGPVVNTRGGVLVLSEGAGAHHQLRPWCLSVSPTDIEGTMQALYQALTMGQQERERRASAMAEAIEREDITAWFYDQVSDLRALTEGREIATI